MFRFTIRELVLLTVIAAVALGWWLDYLSHEGERAWSNRYASLQEAYHEYSQFNAWITRELKDQGYSIQKSGSGWAIAPPLQPAVKSN